MHINSGRGDDVVASVEREEVVVSRRQSGGAVSGGDRNGGDEVGRDGSGGGRRRVVRDWPQATLKNTRVCVWWLGLSMSKP
nr:hypothetical protein [Tanacetum cinerariifolium]